MSTQISVEDRKRKILHRLDEIIDEITKPSSRRNYFVFNIDNLEHYQKELRVIYFRALSMSLLVGGEQRLRNFNNNFLPHENELRSPLDVINNMFGQDFQNEHDKIFPKEKKIDKIEELSEKQIEECEGNITQLEKDFEEFKKKAMEAPRRDSLIEKTVFPQFEKPKSGLAAGWERFKKSFWSWSDRRPESTRSKKNKPNHP